MRRNSKTAYRRKKPKYNRTRKHKKTQKRKAKRSRKYRIHKGGLGSIAQSNIGNCQAQSVTRCLYRICKDLNIVKKTPASDTNEAFQIFNKIKKITGKFYVINATGEGEYTSGYDMIKTILDEYKKQKHVQEIEVKRDTDKQECDKKTKENDNQLAELTKQINANNTQIDTNTTQQNEIVKEIDEIVTQKNIIVKKINEIVNNIKNNNEQYKNRTFSPEEAEAYNKKNESIEIKETTLRKRDQVLGNDTETRHRANETLREANETLRKANETLKSDMDKLVNNRNAYERKCVDNYNKSRIKSKNLTYTVLSYDKYTISLNELIKEKKLDDETQLNELYGLYNVKNSSKYEICYKILHILNETEYGTLPPNYNTQFETFQNIEDEQKKCYFDLLPVITYATHILNKPIVDLFKINTTGDIFTPGQNKNIEDNQHYYKDFNTYLKEYASIPEPELGNQIDKFNHYRNGIVEILEEQKKTLTFKYINETNEIDKLTPAQIKYSYMSVPEGFVNTIFENMGAKKSHAVSLTDIKTNESDDYEVKYKNSWGTKFGTDATETVFIPKTNFGPDKIKIGVFSLEDKSQELENLDVKKLPKNKRKVLQKQKN